MNDTRLESAASDLRSGVYKGGITEPPYLRVTLIGVLAALGLHFDDDVLRVPVAPAPSKRPRRRDVLSAPAGAASVMSANN